MKKKFENIRVIVPVAGMGTRLRPLTHTVPKVLIPVAGKPILAHILDEIQKVGIRKLTIVLGYLGEQIEKYVKTHYDFDVSFCKQEECLGLGHAIYTAKNTVKDGEELLIILGDTLFDADLTEILSNPMSTICVKEVANPKRFGVVITKGIEITDMVEKPQQPISNLAIVGIYYIKEAKELMNALETIIKEDRKTKGEYQLTDALKLLLDNGIKMQYSLIKGWYDCGKPETLLKTNSILLQKKGMKYEYEHRENGVIIIHPVSIGLDVELSQCVIGPYVTIGDGVIIEKSVVSDCIINSYAKVKNIVIKKSIIGEKAIVEGNELSLNVGDSSEIKFSI